MEKPISKLFKTVDDKLWQECAKELEKARKLFPSYRDDDLLMYLLCRLIDGKDNRFFKVQALSVGCEGAGLLSEPKERG